MAYIYISIKSWSFLISHNIWINFSTTVGLGKLLWWQLGVQMGLDVWKGISTCVVDLTTLYQVQMLIRSNDNTIAGWLVMLLLMEALWWTLVWGMSWLLESWWCYAGWTLSQRQKTSLNNYNQWTFQKLATIPEDKGSLKWSWQDLQFDRVKWKAIGWQRSTTIGSDAHSHMDLDHGHYCHPNHTCTSMACWRQWSGQFWLCPWTYSAIKSLVNWQKWLIFFEEYTYCL